MRVNVDGILELFEEQRVLDQRIVKEKDIKHNRTKNLALALLVELGETANETRCFKDWSDKPASEKEIILEEYVDGLHFILSQGLLFGYDKKMKELKDYMEVWVPSAGKERETLTEQFLWIFSMATNTSDFGYYCELFTQYLGLGAMLGFTDEDIIQAYLQKNEVNHKRQDTGY